MVKIPPTKDMEYLLLQDSTTQDLVAAGNTKPKSPNTMLSAQDVRHDVSVFARVLINVYCGWPYHNEILKRKILRALTGIYKNAHDMTILELFEQLKQVIKIIPDNHINLCMVGYNDFARTGLRKPRPNVGANVAGDKMYSIELEDDVGIIAVRTLHKWPVQEQQNFEKQWRKILPKAKTLIIDLRDNGGGGSKPTDDLADYILGQGFPLERKEFVRNNPDANAVKKIYSDEDIDKFNIKSDKDPVVYADHTKKPLPKFNAKKAGFAGPIYVLINGRVMSSAERMCTALRNYPNAKFIGTNTRGGEVYGYNYAHLLLPHSNMKFNVGCVYRELFVENFELNGYKPDIKCKDGQDAFLVALAQCGKQICIDNSKQDR